GSARFNLRKAVAVSITIVQLLIRPSPTVHMAVQSQAGSVWVAVIVPKLTTRFPALTNSPRLAGAQNGRMPPIAAICLLLSHQPAESAAIFEDALGNIACFDSFVGLFQLVGYLGKCLVTISGV